MAEKDSTHVCKPSLGTCLEEEKIDNAREDWFRPHPSVILLTWWHLSWLSPCTHIKRHGQVAPPVLHKCNNSSRQESWFSFDDISVCKYKKKVNQSKSKEPINLNNTRSWQILIKRKIRTISGLFL
jgi:hypothetical protein